MPFQADGLSRPPDVLQALVRQLQAENEQLRSLLKGAVHQSYGVRSERACVVLGDQQCLDLGDRAPIPAAANDDDATTQTAATRPARRQGKRGQMSLPAHLERIERVTEPGSLDCTCCGGRLHRISEDASEALDWVPAVVRVIRTVRPRYGCRHCREGVVQAPAPARAIPGSLVTTSTLARIATARFAWSIPLNRQLQMLAGQGVVLDRSIPSRWMHKIAWLVRPLYDLTLAYIHHQPRIFCDETRMPIQEKGRRRVRITQFWAEPAYKVPAMRSIVGRLAEGHACDDRPWAEPAPFVRRSRPRTIGFHKINLADL